MTTLAPPDHVLKWLEETCNAERDVPAILAMHPPILAKPHYRVGSFPGGGAAGDVELPDREVLTDGASLNYLVDDIPHHDRLLDIIERNPQVKLILAGHWHIHDIITRGSQVYCSTGSMIEYPLEMRLIELSDKGMEISIVSVAGGRFAEESLIPKYRNDFAAGDDHDRNFTIRW